MENAFLFCLHSVVLLHTQSLHRANKPEAGVSHQQEACHERGLCLVGSSFLFEGDAAHRINKLAAGEETPCF